MGAMTIMLPAPRLLADGLVMVESGRWHDGRLWFAHWGSGEVVAVDLDGRSEVVAPGRATMGWSIDWLPDGRLLVSGEELTRDRAGRFRRTAQPAGRQRARRRPGRPRLRQRRRLRLRSAAARPSPAGSG